MSQHLLGNFLSNPSSLSGAPEGLWYILSSLSPASGRSGSSDDGSGLLAPSHRRVDWVELKPYFYSLQNGDTEVSPVVSWG